MAPLRKPGKIQFLTETRCNGFTDWKLDGAVIGADDNRLFEADPRKIRSRALRSDPFEQLACQIVQLGPVFRL